jgi:BolA protein
MTLTESIRSKLQKAFAPEILDLENESHQHSGPANGETHFRLILVSPAFEGVARVDRQRQVMALFDEERSRGLHALTMRVMTPSEWDKVKDQFEMVSPACHGGSKREKRM